MSKIAKEGHLFDDLLLKFLGEDILRTVGRRHIRTRTQTGGCRSSRRRRRRRRVLVSTITPIGSTRPTKKLKARVEMPRNRNLGTRLRSGYEFRCLNIEFERRIRSFLHRPRGWLLLLRILPQLCVCHFSFNLPLAL